MPYAREASPDPPAAARAHLASAIEHYERALALAPDNLTIRLGHAWCLLQSGVRDRAMAEFRRVVAAGWAAERDMESGGLGWHSITAEAAGYLMPLLDPVADAAELATLTERREQLRRLPRPVTPIAIPLRPGLTALDLADYDARVRFDADGSGARRAWTWIGPDAGWLVYDRRETAVITSALQWFGGATFWMFWQNGYHALAALDDDADGALAGTELRYLAVWRDGNGNGVSERGEVRALADWGIVALSHRFEYDPTHPDEIAWSPAGVTFTDGSTRPTFDLILHPR